MTEKNLDAIQKSCCFTGHRALAHAQIPLLNERLNATLRPLIEERGIVNFLAGGALGFDTLAAECVLSLKKDYPHVKLLLALPCPDQAVKWRKDAQERYERILAAADKHIYIAPAYTPSCMLERNRFLVDHSALCISYLREGAHGGTAYTVAYAQKKGLPCINLY